MNITEYMKEAERTQAPLGLTNLMARISVIEVDVSEGKGNTNNIRFVNGEDFIHGLLGVVGEFQELQRVVNDDWDSDEEYRDALIKECGDAWWYARLLLKSCNENPEIDITAILINLIDAEEENFEAILGENKNGTRLFHVDKISEALKKWIFYGKPINMDEIRTEIATLFAKAVLCDPLANELAGDPPNVDMVMDFDLELWLSEVWEANIAKLRRRFPEKFEESLAQNHDSK